MAHFQGRKWKKAAQDLFDQRVKEEPLSEDESDGLVLQDVRWRSKCKSKSYLGQGLCINLYCPLYFMNHPDANANIAWQPVDGSLRAVNGLSKLTERLRILGPSRRKSFGIWVQGGFCRCHGFWAAALAGSKAQGCCHAISVNYHWGSWKRRGERAQSWAACISGACIWFGFSKHGRSIQWSLFVEDLALGECTTWRALRSFTKLRYLICRDLH